MTQVGRGASYGAALRAAYSELDELDARMRYLRARKATLEGVLRAIGGLFETGQGPVSDGRRPGEVNDPKLLEIHRAAETVSHALQRQIDHALRMMSTATV